MLVPEMMGGGKDDPYLGSNRYGPYWIAGARLRLFLGVGNDDMLLCHLNAKKRNPLFIEEVRVII